MQRKDNMCRRESPTMPRRLIPYHRFSGKRQEAGDSLRRQEELSEQAAREEGVPIDRTVTLRDKGISAFRGDNWKRGDLGRFLDLVDAGVIPKGTILCIEQVNRLSRMDWMEQVELWKAILSRGIVIRTCVPPARYTRENMSELGVGCPVVLYMMLGHLDSKQKGEWVRQAWAQKKRKAASERTPHGRGCPEWIEPVCEPHPLNPNRVVTKEYRLRADRAEVVRQIFEWSVGGLGAWRIHRQLVESGTPAWSHRGVWSLAYVRWMLYSRLVLGEYQPMVRDSEGNDVPDGTPIPNYYPAAISEDLWQAAQAARRSRRNKGGRRGVSGVDTNLFTHLVFEATSKQGMFCCGNMQRGKAYRWLQTDPRSHGVPYDAFEEKVLLALAQLRPEDVDGRRQANALTARVDDLQQERSRLGLEVNSLDQQLRELPPERWPRRVVARMAELEEAITAKDEELRQAKEAADTSSRSESLADLQTCVKLLRKVKGTAEEATVRQRIKTRIPLLVESIWVRVQKIGQSQRFTHIRIYLHGGEERYFLLGTGKGQIRAAPWPLGDADFRAGEGCGDAVDAEPTPQLSA
jgi:hypothetical protein